ncbi:hypothetical protein A3D78_04735 [Candidatus Gottesmanbacteria bacterium RIFCSPHIGHO2_02_FULL_39_14]|uniref:Peptidase M24 domain-containing protein n=2 Tax=Candidatus Gottesmaniibacteriota TaxID=1752720 RepID=A0A1F5ZTJ0_9BACT|nr:MAG: hypothetical protein A3D78_04735 [Candidatus Gottesmanbacteria bacterium RIFCSPHIGHO2_02_FULL_39_14]OGG30963.1 MAG: hypothetical protein A3I51_02245 [Candidatus Gottesmanbacteria bacterium RIFCSPLOWO2_02_FULL_38_8]
MTSNRIRELKRKIKSQRWQSFLVSDSFNVSYLTGVSFLTPYEHEAYLLVTLNNTYFITFSTYYGLYTIKSSWQVHYATPFNKLTSILTEIIKKEKIKTMAIEKNSLNLSEYLSLKNKLPVKLILTQDIIEKLRIIKIDSEIKNIHQAAKITDRSFSFILKQIKKGMSERELALKIEFFIKENAQNIAFSPIVAFNKNAAIPHYIPSDKVKLAANSLILLDFGAKVNNYCADLSRVVFFGTPTNRLVKIYQTVLDTQQKALNALHPQVSAKTIDSIARKLIEREGFPSFQHGLGHGVGLAIHEDPRLNPQSTDKLMPNMVFTIEPGIYLPGFAGVRIEDLLVLRREGPEILSKSTKEIIIL